MCVRQPLSPVIPWVLFLPGTLRQHCHERLHLEEDINGGVTGAEEVLTGTR